MKKQVPGRHAHHVLRALVEIAHHRRLEARVHRAVLAERVLARLPVLPVGLVPELVPGLVVLLADQVAGALPAQRRAGDRRPRRAVVVALAGGELEEHRRRGDAVLLRDLEHALELLVDVLARQEDVVLDRLVLVARRDQHAVDRDLGELAAQLLHLVDVGFLEDRGVGGGVVAAALRLADHRQRLLVDPVLGADVVVGLLEAVEVDVDGQALVRRDDAEHLLVEQQRVGAEVDVAPALDDAGDQLGQLRVDGRLAAADRDRGRAALLHRLQARFDRHAVLELAGVPLLGAAEAGQVAGVERLEHEHEREPLVALHRVLDAVPHHVGGHVEWMAHGPSSGRSAGP